MASKNKKIKDPGADQNIFNMIRDYCKAPWVSTNKELPESNKFILLAYYSGADVGYRMAMGWLHKHPLPKKKVKDELNSYIYASSLLAKTIDVSDTSTNSGNRSSRDMLYSSAYEREDNLDKNYEVIEEDGVKKALIWFICGLGDSFTGGIFKNSKSADSTFFPDLDKFKSPVKEYSKPDFWMYVPDIK